LFRSQNKLTVDWNHVNDHLIPQHIRDMYYIKYRDEIERQLKEQAELDARQQLIGMSGNLTGDGGNRRGRRHGNEDGRSKSECSSYIDSIDGSSKNKKRSGS